MFHEENRSVNECSLHVYGTATENFEEKYRSEGPNVDANKAVDKNLAVHSFPKELYSFEETVIKSEIDFDNNYGPDKEVHNAMYKSRTFVEDNASKIHEIDIHKNENVLDKNEVYKYETDSYNQNGWSSKTYYEPAVDNIRSESLETKHGLNENINATNVENDVDNNLLGENIVFKTEPDAIVHDAVGDTYVENKNDDTGKAFPNKMFSTYTSNDRYFLDPMVKSEPTDYLKNEFVVSADINKKEMNSLVADNNHSRSSDIANMNEEIEVKIGISEDNRTMYENFTEGEIIRHSYLSMNEKTEGNVDIKIETDEQVYSYIDEGNTNVDAMMGISHKVYIKTEPLPDDITGGAIDHTTFDAFADSDNNDLKIEFIVKCDDENKRGGHCDSEIKGNNENMENTTKDDLLQSLGHCNVLLTESVGRTYKCHFCGKSFPSSQHLNGHSRIHVDKIYRCDKCDKVFGSLKNLKAHQVNHRENCYTCLICNKSFAKRSLLNQHTNVHSKERMALCQYCGQSFTREADLNRHLKIHTLERDHVCGICGRSYVTPYELKYHMVVHDEHGKSNKCEICNKSYKYKRDLTSHMSVHSVDSQHICTICEKVFDKKSNLSRHLRTHMDARPFSCDLCGKSFKDASYLKRHEIRHNKSKEKVP